MKSLTQFLLIVGGLNWLLFGLFGWDIGQLFGSMDSTFSKLVYILVGLSALYQLFGWFSGKKQMM